MARRRQEIALQTEIETQEEWNEAVNKEGLTGNEKQRFFTRVFSFVWPIELSLVENSLLLYLSQ